MGVLLSALMMFWGSLSGSHPEVTFDQLVMASQQAQQAAAQQLQQEQSALADNSAAGNGTMPAQPLKAAKDAAPLVSHYTQDELARMPVIEAHGETRDRSEPFGQTLLNGKKDPTNGPLKRYRIVSFYGNPHSSAMGILGTMKPDAMMAALKKQTQAYADADPGRPAVPAIELITTIAQRTPGPKGLYMHETSEQDIWDYAKLAQDNGAYLVLDVQLGRDSVMDQVKMMTPYLNLPFVTVAIDTEFHVGPGQVPGVDLGHVDGKDIEQAIQYVNDLTVQNHLPDKFVVVHQFRDDIIYNKSAIKPADHVEVVLNGDGFGSPGQKMAGYHLLVHNEPIQYGGFKLFYKEDHPLLAPKDVLTLDPAPAFINYE